jgi:predicted transcriptional regulator of viral defense system
MNKISKLTALNSASFFTKITLQEVVGGNKAAISANIVRWIKNGSLVSLKKGTYVTKEYVTQHSNNQDYSEFIANTLKKPSYLSGEYVLQKYGMLSESVFSLTSVTLKKTRNYSNKIGVFLYSKITSNLFLGYTINSKSGFEIKEATKSKALFDFLYFRLRTVSEINQEIINSYRLNIESLTIEDYKEFQRYVDISGIEKFSRLVSYLKQISK